MKIKIKIDKEFLSVLLKERYGIYPTVRKNAEDITKDVGGNSSAALASTLRFLGATEYLAYNDVSSFKKNLEESAEIYRNLFVRYNSGEPISESYVSMTAFQHVFDALAVGNFELAQSFASLMGGRDEIEKRNDHPFAYAFGYALKAFVLGNQPEMEINADEFSEVCRGDGNFDFSGYADMFQAILRKNNTEANNAVASILKGHVKQSKGRGVFKYTDDEHLCIWGIGITNLARSYGLQVHPSPPLIPPELVIPESIADTCPTIGDG